MPSKPPPGKPFGKGKDSRRKKNARLGTGLKTIKNDLLKFNEMKPEKFFKLINKPLPEGIKGVQTVRKAFLAQVTMMAMEGNLEAIKYISTFEDPTSVSPQARKYLQKINIEAKPHKQQFDDLLFGYASGVLTAKELQTYAEKLNMSIQCDLVLELEQKIAFLENKLKE
jgi:hypothetical protein